MCILKIYSETRSFKRFAAESTTLPAFSVHDKGEVRSKETGREYQANRISFVVSECDWDDLEGQISDAIIFLGEHGDTLRQLLTTHDVSLAFLDFALWSRLGRNDVANQSDYLPVPLLRLCGEIGIAIVMSTYPDDDTPDEEP